jgi:hypothetical protein
MLYKAFEREANTWKEVWFLRGDFALSKRSETNLNV